MNDPLDHTQVQFIYQIYQIHSIYLLTVLVFQLQLNFQKNDDLILNLIKFLKKCGTAKIKVNLFWDYNKKTQVYNL